MDIKAIKALAKQAEEQGDIDLAVILFTYLGAKYTGTEKQLAHHVAQFARASVHQIHYDEWVDTGGQS